MHTAPETKNAVQLVGNNLTVGYNEAAILNQVDFEVPNAQVTVLVGPNGSGKSTLLKALARILSPRAGQVLLDGKDIHHISTREVAQKLGLLPQGPIAPEGLTVRELVAQGRFPHQKLLKQWSSKDEQAINEAMSAANVTEFSDRPVDDLSGGQRQRCWIAMVLAQETDIILLDEPTTFLDLKVQVDLMNLLVRLAHETNRTLVVVLHELSLAAAYADHLVMMRDGAIMKLGPPSDIFTSANLKDVFDLDAHVIRDPHSHRLICVPAMMSVVSDSIKVGVSTA